MIHDITFEVLPGLPGKPGPAGAPGRAATYYWGWNANAITDADPGGGMLGANTTDLSAISFLYFDNVEAFGSSVGAWLDSLDDTGNTDNRGQLHLVCNDDPEKSLRVQVVGAVTTGVSYRKVAVQFISEGLPFEAGDTIAVGWYPVGIGQAATVTVGSTSFVPYGDPTAGAYNNGTAGDRIVDFILMEGPPGADSTVPGPPGTGTVNSVDISGGATGITFPGGPITTSGSFTFTISNATTFFDLVKQSASATYQGVVELATTAEVQTGTANLLVVTPAGLTAKEATASQYRNNTADRILTTDEVWTSAAIVALVDGATIALDLATGINFSVTLGGNRSISSPTNPKVGQAGKIYITQDGTGSRTLTFGSNYKWAGGVSPSLTAAAGAVDELYYEVQSATRISMSIKKDVK